MWLVSGYVFLLLQWSHAQYFAPLLVPAAMLSACVLPRRAPLAVVAAGVAVFSLARVGIGWRLSHEHNAPMSAVRWLETQDLGGGAVLACPEIVAATEKRGVALARQFTRCRRRRRSGSRRSSRATTSSSSSSMSGIQLRTSKAIRSSPRSWPGSPELPEGRAGPPTRCPARPGSTDPAHGSQAIVAAKWAQASLSTWAQRASRSSRSPVQPGTSRVPSAAARTRR